jgi:hypothetical protein
MDQFFFSNSWFMRRNTINSAVIPIVIICLGYVLFPVSVFTLWKMTSVLILIKSNTYDTIKSFYSCCSGTDQFKTNMYLIHVLSNGIIRDLWFVFLFTNLMIMIKRFTNLKYHVFVLLLRKMNSYCPFSKAIILYNSRVLYYLWVQRETLNSSFCCYHSNVFGVQMLQICLSKRQSQIFGPLRQSSDKDLEYWIWYFGINREYFYSGSCWQVYFQYIK